MMALALVVGAVGLSIVPTVAALGNCDKDFDIADSKALAQKRALNPSASDVGYEDITAAEGDRNVTVELLTDGVKLEFEIFELDGSCLSATHVSPEKCEDPIVLDTTQSGVEQDSETCTLEADSLGTRDFYILFDSPDTNGVQLEYMPYLET